LTVPKKRPRWKWEYYWGRLYRITSSLCWLSTKEKGTHA